MRERPWPVNRHPLPRIRATGLVLGLLLALAAGGCGVKGPPVPPRRAPLPAVENLTYRMDGRSVVLDWQLAGAPPEMTGHRAAFGLYRSRSSLAEAPCDDCPLIFQKVDTIPYTDAKDGRFTTMLRLAPGYRYRFKIRLESGTENGPDSNRVQFDLPEQDTQPAPEKP